VNDSVGVDNLLGLNLSSLQISYDCSVAFLLIIPKFWRKIIVSEVTEMPMSLAKLSLLDLSYSPLQIVSSLSFMAKSK